MAAASLSWCILGILLLPGLVFPHPLFDDDVSSADEEEDSQVVESTVREVRALPPPNFDLQTASTGGHYGSHGGGGHGDVGYLRTKDSKGDNGYKKFDSYHKKDGDSYGFETHSSFGNAHGGETGGQHHHSSSYKDGHSGGDSYHGGHDSNDGGHGYEGAGTEQKEKFSDDHEGAGTEGEIHFSEALTDGGHHYGGHDGGSGEHHSSHYSSGEGGHHGDGEHHSAHYTSGGSGYHGEYDGGYHH